MSNTNYMNTDDTNRWKSDISDKINQVVDKICENVKETCQKLDYDLSSLDKEAYAERLEKEANSGLKDIMTYKVRFEESSIIIDVLSIFKNIQIVFELSKPEEDVPERKI